MYQHGDQCSDKWNHHHGFSNDDGAHDCTTRAGQTTQLTLVTKNYAFDRASIAVPAGSKIQFLLDNQDSGIPHNIVIYTSSAATTGIFKGEIMTGPMKTTSTFDPPTPPGTYYFRCDLHPNMNGQFIVQ